MCGEVDSHVQEQNIFMVIFLLKCGTHKNLCILKLFLQIQLVQLKYYIFFIKTFS